MLRCPLCASLSHAPLTRQLRRCRLCALVFPAEGATTLAPFDQDGTAVGARVIVPNWNNWLFRSTGMGLHAGPDAGRVLYSPLAVREYAAKCGLVLRGLGTNLPLTRIFVPTWRFGRSIGAWMTLPDNARAGPDKRLTLGIMTTTQEWADVVALCSDMVGSAHETVIVLDTDDTGLARQRESSLRNALDTGMAAPRIRVLAHRLDRDFASQRNRIQVAAETEWVLQLDSDERLTAVAKALLPAILDDAERNAWSAVALPRRNVVDGTLSALYPDVQGRLVRKDVRFVRPVHEYPDVAAHATFAFLAAEIVHSIDGSRLARREVTYDGIQQGAGRPSDTALLRTPLEDGIWLPRAGTDSRAASPV